MTLRTKLLDPFSEVLDKRRRWTPDWYDFLDGVVNEAVSISDISNTSLPIKGVTDGSNAVAGNVGEYISASGSATVPAGGPVWTSVVNIILTPGDWDVTGSAVFDHLAAGSSVITDYVSISTNPDNITNTYALNQGHTTWAGVLSFAAPSLRISFSGSNQAWRLIVYSFPGGPTSGYIQARRAR